MWGVGGAVVLRVLFALIATQLLALMALMSAWIAKLLTRHAWISWIGLAIILYVAADMIWTGTHQIGCQFVPANACQAGALATFRTLL